MKLLFNHENKGQEEIKKLLGFLNADISYENLETDIALNTPYLIQFIGKAMYEALHAHYIAEVTEDEALDQMLTNAQLYILLKAYLDYASNGDILHGNTGRKIHFAENEKTPWDWQIKMDNGALKRRAYRALDRLMEVLDAEAPTQWISSENYQVAKSLFLYNTNQFQKVFPIDNSGVLYYQLLPFMADVEREKLITSLGTEKYTTLKSKLKGTPDAQESELILYCQKITAYRVLERRCTLLPDEIFAEEINYRLPEGDREIIRDKRSAKFAEIARGYEQELERILSRQNSEEYTLNPTHGIIPGKKHVNL